MSNSNDRNDILDAFSEFYNQINRCFVVAIEKEFSQEVERLDKIRDDARVVNDQLLHTAYEAWMDNTEELMREFNSANSEVNRALDELEKEGNAIGKIVFALDRIESVLGKVKKIFLIS